MADRGRIPEFVLELVYAHQHELMADAVGRAVMRAIDAGVGDEFCRDLLLDRNRKHRIAQLYTGAFAAPKLDVGDLVLGRDAEGRPVRVPLEWLKEHALTLASTGAGKTNRIQFLVLQVAPRVAGMWLFDLRKREFRKLRPLLKRAGVELVTLAARRMRYNPLQTPDGVTATDWAPRIAELFVQVMDAPPRATKVLQNTLHGLYRTFSGGSAGFPTLFDLRKAIHGNREINAQSREALLDGLDVLLHGLGPDVLAQRRGWSVADLARCHINFQLDGISDPCQNLLLGGLLLAEFTSRLSRGLSNVPLDLFIAFDEAQRVFSNTAGRPNPLRDQLALVRGLGIGIDASVPTSQGLMPELLSATATKFIGRVGSAADAKLFASAMGLTPEQVTWIFHHARPGLMVAQVGSGDYRYPFVVEFPELKLGDPGPECDDLGPLAGLQYEPATEFFEQACPSATAPTTQATSAFTDERAFRFCRAVVDQPLQPSGEYARLAGVGTQTAVRLRTALVAKGFIREHTLQTGKRGRAAILLDATDAGRTAVTEHLAAGAAS